MCTSPMLMIISQYLHRTSRKPLVSQRHAAHVGDHVKVRTPAHRQNRTLGVVCSSHKRKTPIFVNKLQGGPVAS